MFTTTANHFRSYPMPYFSDSDMPGYDRAGRHMLAVVVCLSCGCEEEVSHESRTIHPCSSECHAPRCPCCDRVEYDKADAALVRVMVKVEPFRSDRLLPRGDDPSSVYTPGSYCGGVGVNALGASGPFVLTRPYHAHVKITTVGDFRAGSGDRPGQLFERDHSEPGPLHEEIRSVLAPGGPEDGAELADLIARRIVGRYEQRPFDAEDLPF